MKKEQAHRSNKGKVQWSQVDFKSLEGIPRVLEFGEKKYGRDNWRKGHLVTETCDSALRHIYSFMSGEDYDLESALHHIDHALSNLMFIKHNLRVHPDLDDRYKGERKDQN